jgi:hypothetical protein
MDMAASLEAVAKVLARGHSCPIFAKPQYFRGAIHSHVAADRNVRAPPTKNKRDF